MNEIIFAKTRYEYPSYTDFWKLVELSGFKTCYVDEIQFDGSIYITAPMNGELKPFIDSKFPKRRGVYEGCEIKLWNLERPSGSGGIKRFVFDNMSHISSGIIDDVIVSDDRLAEESNFIYVPLGSHPDLGNPGVIQQKIYDLIHLSCPSYRRGWLFKDNVECLSNIDGMSIATNGWGEERHARLQASKYMLNIHQDNYKYVEPLRFALAAAYGLPVISEDIYSAHHFYIKRIFEVGSYMQIKAIVERYDELEAFDVGMNFREYLCETYTFRKLLELYL